LHLKFYVENSLAKSEDEAMYYWGLRNISNNIVIILNNITFNYL